MGRSRRRWEGQGPFLLVAGLHLAVEVVDVPAQLLVCLQSHGDLVSDFRTDRPSFLGVIQAMLGPSFHQGIALLDPLRTFLRRRPASEGPANKQGAFHIANHGHARGKEMGLTQWAHCSGPCIHPGSGRPSRLGSCSPASCV